MKINLFKKSHNTPASPAVVRSGFGVSHRKKIAELFARYRASFRASRRTKLLTLGGALCVLALLAGVFIAVNNNEPSPVAKKPVVQPVQPEIPPQATVRKAPTQESLSQDAVVAKKEYEAVKADPAKVKARYESLVNNYAAENDCSKIIATTSEFTSMQMNQMEYNTLNFVYTCYQLKNDREGVKKSIIAQIEVIKSKLPSAYSEKQKTIMLQSIQRKEAELRQYE